MIDEIWSLLPNGSFGACYGSLERVLIETNMCACREESLKFELYGVLGYGYFYPLRKDLGCGKDSCKSMV